MSRYQFPEDLTLRRDAIFAFIKRLAPSQLQEFCRLNGLEEAIDFLELSNFEVAKRLESLAGPYPGFSGEKPYDDRIDYHHFANENSPQWRHFKRTCTGRQIADLPAVRKNVLDTIGSVAAIVQKCHFDKFQRGKKVELRKVIANRLNNMVFTGMYHREPCLARGTAFLIGENLLLTAAHNLANQDGWIPDEELVYIFDYKYGKYGKQPNVDSSTAFQGEKILYPMHVNDDWMVVRLNPLRITGNGLGLNERLPLKLSRDIAHPTVEHPFYSAGFSLGLPMKIVLVGHYVRRLMEDRFAVNLDMFHGNSGSPVISLETNEVVGLFIAGFPDLVENGDGTIGIKEYNYNSIAEGRGGEHCQLIGQIFDRIDNLEGSENPLLLNQPQYQ
jgi:hypothetical protein